MTIAFLRISGVKMNKPSPKKLNELTFDDLFVDLSDQSFPELRETVVTALLSLEDRLSTLPLMHHKGAPWLHR